MSEREQDCVWEKGERERERERKRERKKEMWKGWNNFCLPLGNIMNSRGDMCTGHTDFHLEEKRVIRSVCYGLNFFAHLNVCSINIREIHSTWSLCELWIILSEIQTQKVKIKGRRSLSKMLKNILLAKIVSGFVFSV